MYVLCKIALSSIKPSAVVVRNSTAAESSKAKASFVGATSVSGRSDKSISANTRRLKSREILLRTPERSGGAVSKLLKTQVGVKTPSMT
jgi:hypothetical protein